MEHLKTIINNDFERMLKTDNDRHKFFESFDWWIDQMLPSFETYDKTIPVEYDNKIHPIDSIEGCRHIPVTTISHDEILRIYDKVVDPNTRDFDEIRNLLFSLYDYNLPSTVDISERLSMDDTYKLSTSAGREDTINVIIVGAGPIGLFTALYLHEHYNMEHILGIRANILLLDNRIYQEGIKLPYSRLTQFGFDMKQIVPFITQIFCWQNTSRYENRQFDFINVLENLLYIVAYVRRIPMMFTKKYETFDKLVTLAQNNNFQYIFDCTGGRLKHGLEPTFNWTLVPLTEGDREIRYIGHNVYRFFVNGSEYQHTTLVLHIFDDKMHQIPVGNEFASVEPNDKPLVDQYKNRCLTIEDYNRLISRAQGTMVRTLFQSIRKNYPVVNLNARYIKMTTFNTVSQHAKQASFTLHDRLMYIGLGNTLGTSEYGIKFGLKHGMLFSKHVCNLLSSVRYLT